MRQPLQSAHRFAALCVRIEAGILAAIAAYLTVRTATSTVEAFSAVVAEIIFALLGAAGLFIAGIGFSKKRLFGRGAAVLANSIALGVAYYMVEGGRAIIGIPLALLAITTIIFALAAVPQSKDS